MMATKRGSSAYIGIEVQPEYLKMSMNGNLEKNGILWDIHA
jgi:hypothetical protein